MRGVCLGHDCLRRRVFGLAPLLRGQRLLTKGGREGLLQIGTEGIEGLLQIGTGGIEGLLQLGTGGREGLLQLL